MEDNEKIMWSANEYTRQEKSADWYWTLGIISISASAASFLLGNILFGILILIGAFSLVIYGKKEPEIVDVEISKRGILINDTLYPYNTLKSFWVEENDAEPKIIIESEKVMMPHIIVPIGEIDPDTIKEFLLEYLEEEEHRESLSQKIMEYLGF